jgi:hypothetical protein
MSNVRAQVAYEVLRGGFPEGRCPVPAWDDAPAWVRDLALVAYLQGEIDVRGQLGPALKAILARPDGCVFCDSGTLRNPEKDHDPKCGFAMARAASGKLASQP